MIKRLFSSQLRINMFSGVVATAVNVVVLAIALLEQNKILDSEC
jgi:hypothetical protein